MKTNAKLQPGSRQPFTCPVDLSQRGCTLHHGAGSFLFALLLLSVLPALTGSCIKDKLPPQVEEEPPQEVQAPDSVLTTVRLQAGSLPVRRLDLFIYDAGGTKSLQKYLQLDSLPAELHLPALPGDKVLVGIANSPLRFNLGALGRFEAMEQLQYRFGDDNPEYPILGGFCSSTEESGTIVLRPLLCKIILSTVNNTMDGYELVEEPRVRLRDLPDGAEILREKDFRPSELIDAGAWQALPCDVGYFPQHPGIELWCYPNDTPETVLGVPRPILELECTICGETCVFEVPLPPLERGCTKEVELTIDGPGSYRYKIR